MPLCLFRPFYLHAAAKHFGIGVGSFAAVIFVVGLYGEQGGVYAGKPSRKADDLVPAQIHAHANVLFVIVFYLVFDGLYILRRFDHAFIFPEKAKKIPYRKRRHFSQAYRAFLRHTIGEN